VTVAAMLVIGAVSFTLARSAGMSACRLRMPAAPAFVLFCGPHTVQETLHELRQDVCLCSSGRWCSTLASTAEAESRVSILRSGAERSRRASIRAAQKPQEAVEAPRFPAAAKADGRGTHKHRCERRV